MSAKLSLAIMSLRPGAVFRLVGQSLARLEWLDATQERPTDTAILAEVARLDALAENPLPPPISDRQFAHALWKRGIITFDEAKAFVKTGDMPAALAQLVAGLPAEQREDAEMLIVGSTAFDCAHPLVDAVAAAFGWSTAELHEFWRFAGGL